MLPLTFYVSKGGYNTPTMRDLQKRQKNRTNKGGSGKFPFLLLKLGFFM